MALFWFEIDDELRVFYWFWRNLIFELWIEPVCFVFSDGV